MTEVDIILPTYNSEKYIEETMDSIIKQSFTNWKLIIIDDGSKDDTPLLINKYLNDKRIIFKKLEENKGQGFCRNLALKSVSSNYVAFIDADDIWDKDKLKNQIALMNNLNLDFTYSNYKSFSEIDGVKKFNKIINLPEKFTYNTFVKNTSICTSTIIVRREKIYQAKFLNITSCDDYFFKCELLKNCNFAKKIEENLTLYRISKNSVQSNKFKNLYWVWYTNKKYNKMNIIENFLSILSISFNSIRKYGFK